MLPSGAGSSSGNRACNCTAVSGWLAATSAASTLRLLLLGSLGSRPLVLCCHKSFPSLAAVYALPFHGLFVLFWLFFVFSSFFLFFFFFFFFFFFSFFFFFFF